jgi:uncharacterized protein YeaO (DUF488 family)
MAVVVAASLAAWLIAVFLAARQLRALAADRPVTPLTATKDLDLSQAAVLAGLLRGTR